MDDFVPRKERDSPLFFKIISYTFLGIFGLCFLAGRFYFSDFDLDWQLRMVYGQAIGLGGCFALFFGFLTYNYIRAKYF